MREAGVVAEHARDVHCTGGGPGDGDALRHPGKARELDDERGQDGFLQLDRAQPGGLLRRGAPLVALLPKSTLNMPSSTRTVRAVDEVEAFALRAEDLKFVANQFRRLHSKKLQHTFRFYSYHWRTWAACFVQAAWRRYKKRALAKNLSLAESLSLGDFCGGGSEPEDYEDEDEDGEEESGSQAKMPQLGVTILASRFAANTRRGAAQKVKGVGGEILKIRKPEEPDFSAEAEDERLFHSSLL